MRLRAGVRHDRNDGGAHVSLPGGPPPRDQRAAGAAALGGPAGRRYGACASSTTTTSPCRTAPSARSSRAGRSSCAATGTCPTSRRRRCAAAGCTPATPARWTSDGYIYIQDRVKDMIVSGGENVYPRSVEDVLFQHPAVADAAVIGVPDEQWGETVKAIVVLKEGADRHGRRASSSSAAASSAASSARARSTSSPCCRATRAARCSSASCASRSGPATSAASRASRPAPRVERRACCLLVRARVLPSPPTGRSSARAAASFSSRLLLLIFPDYGPEKVTAISLAVVWANATSGRLRTRASAASITSPG